MRLGVASIPRLGIALLLSTSACVAQVRIAGKVVDETGVAVAGARVELRTDSVATSAISEVSGNFSLQLEKPGEYSIRAEREGFFLFTGKSSEFVAGANQLIITLNHLREFTESIDVTYSPPAIDLQEPAERKQLNNVEILSVPYPAPHDLRSALPLLPGVVQDVNGRLHFNGGETSQTNFMLDGFNISDPVTGRLDARLNIDTVQSLDWDSARFTAERGRGSSGSLDLRTKMGDDRWRFGTTNFVPSVSSEGGLHLNKWTPRLEVSGPFAKGRAWFHNGFDMFYDVDVVRELPPGQNRARSINSSNLSRFQVNLTPANILTGSMLVNYSNRRHYGLSFLDPLETTTNRRQDLYMYTLKDQMYFHGGALVEFGFAGSSTFSQFVPRGTEIYQITPWGRRGNYFVDLDRHAYRQQWLSNVFLPALRALGSHQLKFGVDLERESFRQQVARHDYEVLRVDNSVARRVTFQGNPFQGRRNFEAAQYLQDRWTPVEGVLVEAGLRSEWDEVVRSVNWSPRLSVVWAPRRLRDTKLAGGYGIFHDALVLGTITRHQDQTSLSTFFTRDGQIRGPAETAFLVDEQNLRVPSYRIASFSLERKLPFDFYGRASYTHKTGNRGFVFVNDQSTLEGVYHLSNIRRDRYRALELTVRRTFAGQFEWMANYTRSSARSNAAVDYSLENPLFGPQAPGPYPWDTPHRFLTWGWAPVPKRLLPKPLQFIIRETSIAYLGEYRTGFPFNLVNEEDMLVGAPNSCRFPSYFNINLTFERKFRFFHYLWAWRFGFINLTNSLNPNVVNNDVDSPTFMTYGRGQARAFTVRLRFLGKR